MTIFAECIKRLYQNNKINEKKVESLFLSGKLTKEEKNDILNAR